MGLSLGLSYSVSRLFYFILRASHIRAVDVIYDTMHYAYVTFLIL